MNDFGLGHMTRDCGGILFSGITPPDVKPLCVNWRLGAREKFLERVDDPRPVVSPKPTHFSFQARHPGPLFNQLWRECWWHSGTFRCVRRGFAKIVICRKLLVSLLLVDPSRCKQCTHKFTGRGTTRLHCRLNWLEPAHNNWIIFNVAFFIVTIIPIAMTMTMHCL